MEPPGRLYPGVPPARKSRVSGDGEAGAEEVGGSGCRERVGVGTGENKKYPFGETMNDQCAFEILVYRLSPEERDKEREKIKVAKWGDSPFGRWENGSTEQPAELRTMIETSFAVSYDGRSWKYNDVIGYIAIFADKFQIKGEHWMVEGRIREDMKKRVIRHHDKVFKIWVTPADTAESLQERIKIRLHALKLEWPFKGRYIDTNTFDLISPFIDWKKLTDSL